MKLAPFALERWFAKYEFNVDINLCASCAPVITTGELLGYAGETGRKEYLDLPLDYIESMGTDRLRAAVANQYQSINPSQVLVTTGASEAITLLMLATVSAGDEIVVQWPIYQSLYSLAESLGAKVKKWHPAANWHWDIQELKQMLHSGVSMLIINSPHSPTGHCLSADQTADIRHLALKHNVRLLFDEVYRGIFYTDAIGQAGADICQGAVSIGDLTKPYGLGGLRVGWIATSDHNLLNKCAQIRDYTTMCCAAPSEFLAAVALEHGDALLQSKMLVAQKNIDFFAEFVDRFADKLKWQPPQGGFVAFPGFVHETDDVDFCRRLVETEDVLLMPGTFFGYPGHFRIGFGLPEAEFVDGLRRLERFLSC